jgi:PAS domain S-box-containing protein
MSISADSLDSTDINNFQKEIILQAPVPIFVVEGPEFIITLSNEKKLEEWQRTQEEVLGKPLFDIFPEGKKQQFIGFLTEVYKTGVSIKRKEERAEFYRNGTLDIAWFNIHYQPLKNAEGEVYGILAISVEVTEQVLARKKAENSEKEIRQMADAMPHLVWIADESGSVIFYNRRVYEYCGLDEDTNKDLLWQNIIHPEDFEKTSQAWQKAIEDKTPYSIQHRLKMKDGSYRWYLNRANFIENRENNTIRWFGSGTDVHEQKQVELKIKQTEEFNRTVLESNPDCLKVVDKAGRVQYMNVNGQCLMEIDDFKKIKNKQWSSLWEAENQILVQQSLEKALNGETVQFVAFCKTAKGTPKWWDIVVSPIRNSMGEVNEILSISRDITLQKQTENKLIQTRELLETTLLNVPSAIYHFDKEGNILYANELAAYQMGYNDAKELVAEKDFFQFRKTIDERFELFDTKGNAIPPGSGSAIITIDSGKPSEMVVRFVNRKTKDTFWLLNRSVPLTDDKGNLTNVFTSCTDISEQKFAEEEVEEARNFLELTLHNVPSAIYHLDRNGNILYLNELAAKQMGYDNVAEVMADKDVHSFRKRLDENFLILDENGNILGPEESCTSITLKTRKPAEVVVQFINKKHQESFWLLTKSVPLLDEKGDLSNIFTTCTDITAQKKSEEALRRSESRYRRIFENTPVSIWEEDFSVLKQRIGQLTQQGITDFDSYFKDHRDELNELIDSVIIKDVNAASLKLYNCSKEEILSGLRQFYAEETLPAFVEGFKIIAQGGGHYESESVVKIKSGEVINLMVFIDFPNSEDDYSSVQVIRFDITEQKRSDKLIKESEEKYRSLFETMDQGFCIVEVIFDDNLYPIDYRFLEYNSVFENHTGITNVIGKTITEIIPDIEKFWIETYGQVALTGKSKRFVDESEVLNKWFEVYAFSVGEASKNRVAILFTDISERKKSEQELKASEEKFKILTESIPQMVWMSDEKGNSEYLSSQWEKYAGKMPADEYWTSICHPSDLEKSMEDWKKSIIAGEKMIAEARLRNKEGEYRWHFSVMIPLKNEKGEVIKWIGSVMDIHDQKLKEQKKDEFISIASHEMKTPLTSAKAYLQLVEMSLDENHDASLYTQKASNAVERLNKLISELLDASKIQHGKLHYNNSVFDFDRMVNDTIENVQYSSSTHKIIKKGQIEKQFFGDKDRLQQVIINLLTNAIKYSPNANEVVVEVQQANDYLQVSVVDKGIGMPEKHLKRIFERYYRVQEHSVQFQGLGIGLYISYDIIMRHNGKMWVESSLGNGSMFHFTLPFVN